MTYPLILIPGVARADRLALDLDDRLHVHPDPRLLAAAGDGHLDLAERGFERHRPVTPGDGRRPASDEPAPRHHDPLTRPRPAVVPAGDHEQGSLQQDVLFERRPV